MGKRNNTVWLVWASRGDYSNHTEYPVCWFDTEAEAKALSEKMVELSDVWRRKVADADDETPYGELWDKARLAIGDEDWSPGDETEYRAVELKRGRP
jgi:hypothetical protein